MARTGFGHRGLVSLSPDRIGDRDGANVLSFYLAKNNACGKLYFAMQTFRIILAFILATASCLAVPPQMVRAYDSLDDFIARFDKLIENRARYTDWTKPGSPWTPYLSGQFTGSLTAEERRQHLAAQDEGDCAAVAELEQIGFLRLNPVLKPAFERPDVRKVFADEIIRFRSNGSYRCRALNLYREGLQRLKQSGATIIPIDVPRLRRQGLKQWPPDPRVSWMLEHKRSRGLYYLTYLALCREYPPAIKDVLRVISAPRVLILSDEEEFYLAARARQLGFNAPVIGERYETLYYKLKPRTRVTLEFAAEGSEVRGELRRKLRCYPDRG